MKMPMIYHTPDKDATSFLS